MAETTLLNLRPSRLIFFGSYVGWIFLWILAVLTYANVGGLFRDEWRVPGIDVRVQTVLAWFLGFLGLLLVLAAELKRITIRYTITDSRVIRTEGIVRRKTNQMPLNKIERVELDQGLVQRILKLGDLVIDTGEDTITLGSIRHVGLVQDELSKHVAATARRG